MSEPAASDPVSRKPKTWLKIFIPIFTILLLILSLEIVLRVLDSQPKRDWFHRQPLLEISGNPLFNLYYADEQYPKIPHSNRDYPGYVSAIRDQYYHPQKPANTFRILGTGDSFAWGWGVFDTRMIFFKRLECWFQAEKRQTKIEVINAAQPAWSTWDEEKMLDGFGYGLDPDLVILSYNLNDGAHFHGIATFNAWAEMRVKKRENWLHKISYLYRFIDVRITRAHVHNWTVQTYHDSYLGTRQNLWNVGKDCLLRISRQCKKRNITLVVSIFPLLVSLEKKEYLFAREIQVIEAFLKKHNIICHNMLPDFMGKKSESLWTLPTDSHPNERGHQIAAESLYRFLSQNHLLPEQ